MTASSLTGKVVLLAGCTGDIGVAYLNALSEAGANVVAVDLADGAEVTKNVLGPGEVAYQRCDITSDYDVDAAVGWPSSGFAASTQ